MTDELPDWEIVPGEAEVFGFTLLDDLDTGELATGTPTWSEEGGGTNLTIDNPSLNTATKTLNCKSYPAGTVVQARFQVNTAKLYERVRVSMSIDTTGTPVRTLVRHHIFHVVPRLTKTPHTSSAVL